MGEEEERQNEKKKEEEGSTVSRHRFWIWGSTHLGVYTLGVYSGGLLSGGLQSQATNCEFGQPLIWGLYSGDLFWGPTLGVYCLGVYSLTPPISDLDNHLPVLRKEYRGPFNVNVV